MFYVLPIFAMERKELHEFFRLGVKSYFRESLYLFHEIIYYRILTSNCH